MDFVKSVPPYALPLHAYTQQLTDRAFVTDLKSAAEAYAAGPPQEPPQGISDRAFAEFRDPKHFDMEKFKVRVAEANNELTALLRTRFAELGLPPDTTVMFRADERGKVTIEATPWVREKLAGVLAADPVLERDIARIAHANDMVAHDKLNRDYFADWLVAGSEAPREAVRVAYEAKYERLAQFFNQLSFSAGGLRSPSRDVHL